MALQRWCYSGNISNTTFADLSSFYTGTVVPDFAGQYNNEIQGVQPLLPAGCSLPKDLEVFSICGPSQPNCTLASRTPGETQFKDPYDPYHTPYPPWAFDSTETTESSSDCSNSLGDKVTMPYNSTLWLNGKKYDLQAPTLDPTAGCHTYNGLSCTCYQGQPIAYDYMGPSTQCIGTGGYSWGSSLSFLIVALSLEIAWIVGCYAVWLHAELTSELLQHAWTATDDVKNALSIAACVETESGTEAFAYSDGKIMKALCACDDVGHEIRRAEDGSVDVGILGARMNRRPRRSTKIDSMEEGWHRGTSKDSETRMLTKGT